MTGSLDDVYARARLIEADVDLLAALARTLGCDPTDLPAPRPYNAESAEHEADDDPWIGDDRWLQQAADNWTERELS